MRYLLPLFLLLVGCSKFQFKSPEQKQPIFKAAWIKNLDPEYTSGNLPIGLGAPSVFKDIVFMGSLEGYMRAYDLETGRVLWSVKEETALGAPVEFFSDHIAYGGQNGRLFVRHYLTGKLKYAIDLNSPVESAPLFHQGRLLVYLRGHQIVHMDAETGKILWVYKRAVPITTTLQRVTRPLIIGNKIIVGFADGFVGALSAEEGLLLWETKIVDNSKFMDVDLDPLLVGGVIITGSPSADLKAINPENGALAQSFGVNVMANPMVKNEQLILGTTDGDILLMGLDGKISKQIKISDQPVSAVTWWKDYIIAASFDGVVRAINPLNMKVVDSFHLGHAFSAVFSDFVTQNEYLTLYSSRNRLYVFK
jgi:outer membrane protein assembly factor BamB